MRKLTKAAKAKVCWDLTLEDIKPQMLIGRPDEELIKAWESYNGEMPADWIEVKHES